jgi:bacteriocin biosynthesis cyclodehydratase domain-containing protein
MGGDVVDTQGRRRRSRAVCLPRRFELLRISATEYRLVSLGESLRIAVENDDGDLLDCVLPLLRRGSTLSEIHRAVGVDAEAKADTLLADLERSGLLERWTARKAMLDVGEQDLDSQMRFFANFQSAFGALNGAPVSEDGGTQAQQRLERSAVVVLGLGRAGSLIARTLASIGVGSIIGADRNAVANAEIASGGFDRAHGGVPREEAMRDVLAHVRSTVRYSPLGAPFGGGSWPAAVLESDLLVVCDDQFDPESYEAVNRACLEHGLRWTSFRDFGNRFELGPTIVPHETACFRCYELRRRSNDDSYGQWRETAAALAKTGTSLGAPNVVSGASLVAVEVAKLLTGFSRPVTRSAVFSFDLITFEARLHPVLKIPRCRICGAAARGKPPPRIWRPEDTTGVP